MTTTLTALPTTITAGTTVKYRKSLTDYPASEWTLTLYLAGVENLSQVAEADDESFLLTLSAATTAKLKAGLYKWIERVAKDDEVYEVDSGVVTVTPDLAAAGEGTEQEWIERAIAALKAHIEGRIPAGIERGSIAGREISKIPIKEAIQILDALESRLAHMADPETITRPILISFVKPGMDQ